MILSICIPIYNFDVNTLVNRLLKEVSSKALDVELLVIDDASNLKFLEINAEAMQRCHFSEKLAKNSGRSAIRNRFLRYAKGDYLCFLDCDGELVSDDFIENYIDFIKASSPDVVYGGRIADVRLPQQQFLLRWNYAHHRENLSVERRQTQQYLSFQTNNFVVKKHLFETFKFNENLKNYGYEDLLFALELKEASIKIHHIDNPILNADIELNSVFVKKAAESAQSLAYILKDKNLAPKVAALRLNAAYQLVLKWRLVSVVNCIFWSVRSLVEYQLKSGKANLRLLDFYKLGILCQAMGED